MLRRSLTLLISAAVLAATAHAQSRLSDSEYAPNQVIVWFQPGVVTLPTAQGNVNLDEVSFANAVIQSRFLDIRATAIRMLTPTATRANLLATPPSGSPIPLDQRQLDMYVVSLADTEVTAALALLNADAENVVIAEPD